MKGGIHMLTRAAPAQGGTPVAASPTSAQAVSAGSLKPAPGVQASLEAPLGAVLRQVTYPIQKPLGTRSSPSLSGGGTLTLELANAGLGLGVEMIVTASIVVSLAASTATGSKGGGIQANARWPFSLLQNVAFQLNQQNNIVNASGWMLFQDLLHSVMPGVDPRQQKSLAPTGTPVAGTWPVPTYASTITPSGGAASNFLPGASYYNTTTAAQDVTIAVTFPLFVPFVNNFVDFLGLVPSAAQDINLALPVTIPTPVGNSAVDPLQFLSGADITGASSVSSMNAQIQSSEWFLNSPPSGMEAAYAPETSYVVQRFEDRGTVIGSTGRNAARYVAPQGANLLRMIAEILIGGVPDTSDVQAMRMTLSEFSDVWEWQLLPYLSAYYRLYGRVPDPGIFVWDGTYTAEVPNSGDTLGWIDAATVIKPTLSFDISTNAVLGSQNNALNVLRVQAVHV